MTSNRCATGMPSDLRVLDSMWTSSRRLDCHAPHDRNADRGAKKTWRSDTATTADPMVDFFPET